MIIEVPLFIQTNQFNCGSTCLKMVLAHFGEHFGIEVLEKRMGVVKDKGVNSIQIAAAASNLGYGVAFYSKKIGFNEENNDLAFYKKYDDIDATQFGVWEDKAKKSGVIIEEKVVNLNELLSVVSEDSIPIALIDWNVISDREEDGYQGHFVPVVGYDHKFVYIHNGGYNDHKANIAVEKELFEKARKARGTDEDLIVIFRKGINIKILKGESVEKKKILETKPKNILESKVKSISKDEKYDKSIKKVEDVSLKDLGIKEEKANKKIEIEKEEIMKMEKEVLEMKKKLDEMKAKIKKQDFKA